MVKWIIQCVTTAAFTLNVNGDRIGYFKGSRGFRQGDPISLYLFTLIMEIFSLTLQREIDNELNFQYHFGCKSIKLSHVCFADDLLVMCHGDATSVGVIKKALDAFSACSRLLPNYSKSIVFFGSMNEEDRTAISSIIPFITGKLPVIYLGVPFIAKRLGVNKCGCLLDKIKIKLRGKSIWEFSVDQEDSWGWKNLLGIRDQIKDKVFITYRDLYDERLNSGLKVSDMIGNGEWKWPSDWNLDTPYPIFGYGVLTNTPYPFLGYGVLAENVFFLIFDQSIIYGVSMAYSSKSGNGLEFFKVFRYGVLDSISWAPRIKYSKILTQEIGYVVSDFWIWRIDQYAISIFLDTEYWGFWIRSIG
ncbi:RNA-directed DNA polymerase, eukaryota, reverse transcriptase zinc-binding domain protein [Tanacetum coccineum]